MEAEVRPRASWESWSTLNLTESATRQMGLRSGHAEDKPGCITGLFSRHHIRGKSCCNTTHFSFPPFFLFVFSLLCLSASSVPWTPLHSFLLNSSSLMLHLSPSFRPTPVSSFPSSPLISPCSISHICPHSLRVLSAALPKGFLNCFFISTAGFLFTLQVKQRN